MAARFSTDFSQKAALAVAKPRIKRAGPPIYAYF
jgi:hypothetical protein